MSQSNDQVITGYEEAKERRRLCCLEKIVSAVTGTPKSRPQQKLYPFRTRFPMKKMAEINGGSNKKIVTQPVQPYLRIPSKNVLRQQDETPSRPRSASHSDAEKKSFQITAKVALKTESKMQPTNKRASIIPRRVLNKFEPTTQLKRPPLLKPVYINQKAMALPDQATIRKIEEIELSQSYDNFELMNEKDILADRGDNVLKLINYWKNSYSKYEKSKEELHKKQNNVVDMYKKLKSTKKKLADFGEDTNLPCLENLQIVKLTNSSFERLERKDTADGISNTLSIDLEKLLYKIPTDVLAVCEDTIQKRKSIIDWLESLVKTRSRGISMGSLEKKVNEFAAENDMLRSSVSNTKEMFMKNLDEIAAFIRSRITDVMAMQLRQEELTFEVSKLHTHNVDLQKQLANAEGLRSQNHELKIENLKKELDEEKCKKTMLREHLMRAEGQVKSISERATMLETTLDETRSQNWALDRSVQQLQETNRKLQHDLEARIAKINEHFNENTARVEEILHTRDILQKERNELRTEIDQMIKDNEESMNKLNNELSNTKSLLEDKTKLVEEEETLRIKLEKNVESLTKQLTEEENKGKELKKELDDITEAYNIAKEAQEELKHVKEELQETKKKFEETKKEFEVEKIKGLEKEETLSNTEQIIKDTFDDLDRAKRELVEKAKTIEKLKDVNAHLEEKLTENENKMSSYEKQLTSIKTQITQMQTEFGEFENLAELRILVNEQRSKLLEITRESNQLSEELQNKVTEQELLRDKINELERLIEKKNGVISTLNEKEAEQSKIVKLLKKNWETKIKNDQEYSVKLSAKELEMQELITNKNTQITQLEKVVLSLEDQSRKFHASKRKDQEIIKELENRLQTFDSYHQDVQKTLEGPVDNLDNLIQMLERELGSPFEQFGNPDDDILMFKQNLMNKPQQELENLPNNNNDDILYRTVESLKNINKKLSVTEELKKADKLDRKKILPNVDAKLSNLVSNSPHPPLLKDKFSLPTNSRNLKCNASISRTLPLLSQNLRDEKKSKMFKLAGHKL